MFYFESAFSRKRCIFVGQGGTASGDPPLSGSRASLPGKLRVPWVRVDQTKLADHLIHSVTASKLRIAELCNTTLLALEKISSGYLKCWTGRRCNRSDTVELEQLSNPFDGRSSARCTDLLLRISSFWRDWEDRFRKAGWGDQVDAVNYSKLPAKFSSQYFCAGTPSGTGLSRGDVVPAVLEWIDVPSVEQPIPLEQLSPRLAQLLENWEQHMLQDEHSRTQIARGRKRVYEDPLFRSKKGKLGLAKLLYGANMIRIVAKQRGSSIKCFTVLKERIPMVPRACVLFSI